MAGLHVPTTPLGEVVPKIEATEPAQMAGIAAKFGTVWVFTVTFKVCVVAHCPALGVKV